MKSLKALDPKPGEVFADADGDHFTIVAIDTEGVYRVWNFDNRPTPDFVTWSQLRGKFFKINKTYPNVASFIRDRHNSLLDVRTAISETVTTLLTETSSPRSRAVSERKWYVNLFPMSSNEWSFMEESWINTYVSTLEGMGFYVDCTENGVTLSW